MKIINPILHNDPFKFCLIIKYNVLFKTKYPTHMKEVWIERSEKTEYKIKKTVLVVRRPTEY